jgi:hypothetical protein
VRTHLRICHQTWHRIYSALFGAGLALIAVTTVEVDAWAMYRLGLLLALFGGVRLILDKVSADDDDMEAGRQSGYDDGYDDGCSVRQSAVSSAVARLPRRGPAQQLGEHGDVADGHQRIGWLFGQAEVGPQHADPVPGHGLAAFPVADRALTYAEARGEFRLGEAARLAHSPDVVTVHNG